MKLLTFICLLSIPVGILAVIWIGWRLLSRKRLLPCPASISWLVEMENPLAKVTRSERILEQLAPLIDARVADVGCGPGRVTLPLADAVGANGAVFAVDVQIDMLRQVMAKADKTGISRIRPLLADARKIPLAEDTLDAAVMVMALGEMPGHARVLAALHSVLKPGGRLLIAESVFDPHYIRRQTLVTLAKEAGFVEHEIRENRFAYAMVFRKDSAVADAGMAG